MSKGVMKTKPVAKKDEPKPDPYANYANTTTGELADMIADTTDELQSAIRLWYNLNEETYAYQEQLDDAYSRYQLQMKAHEQHLQDKARAEKQVQELAGNLKVLADGFTAKIGKR